MTINDTWGYAKNDTNWKSARELTRDLIDIVSKGGNFLLNVGPTAEGLFPEAINERLARMGEWMKVNGESIYGASRCPLRWLSFDGRCTAKANKLYLQVFNWPAEGLTLRDWETPVSGARALAGGEKLTAKATEEIGFKILRIARPKTLDPFATVVELTLARPAPSARINGADRQWAEAHPR